MSRLLTRPRTTRLASTPRCRLLPPPPPPQAQPDLCFVLLHTHLLQLNPPRLDLHLPPAQVRCRTLTTDHLNHLSRHASQGEKSTLIKLSFLSQPKISFPPSTAPSLTSMGELLSVPSWGCHHPRTPWYTEPNLSYLPSVPNQTPRKCAQLRYHQCQ